jgi:hypothetical protein
MSRVGFQPMVVFDHVAIVIVSTISMAAITGLFWGHCCDIKLRTHSRPSRWAWSCGQSPFGLIWDPPVVIPPTASERDAPRHRLLDNTQEFTGAEPRFDRPAGRLWHARPRIISGSYCQQERPSVTTDPRPLSNVFVYVSVPTRTVCPVTQWASRYPAAE